MLTVPQLHKYLIYLFAFSLNFETLNLFNLNIDYLASKITIVLLFLVTSFNYSAIKTTINYYAFLKSLILFFIYLTVVSYLQRDGSSVSFFYFPLFLDILILFLLLSLVKRYQDVLLYSLVAFSTGTLILALLFFFNIGIETSEDGRISIFDINLNMLGLNACFAIFTFLYFLFNGNKISLLKRFLLLLMIFMLFVMLIKTGSRGAFLSFVFGILLFIFTNKTITKSQKGLIIVAFIVISSLLWIFFLRNSLLYERLVTSINDGDLSNRDLIWINLFDIVLNNYVFGIGVTGYEKIVGDESPHNVLIEVLCYTGLIGLSLFIMFLLKIGRNVYLVYKKNSNILPFILFINSLGLILTGQIFAQKIVWLIFAYQISCFYKIQKNTESCN